MVLKGETEGKAKKMVAVMKLSKNSEGSGKGR